MGPKSDKTQNLFMFYRHLIPWPGFYNFMQYFSVCVFCLTHQMRSGVEFSACVMLLMLEKFQNLEHFGFQIFAFGMLTLYYP